jgi:hypothetical protein
MQRIEELGILIPHLTQKREKLIKTLSQMRLILGTNHEMYLRTYSDVEIITKKINKLAKEKNAILGYEWINDLID